MRTPLELQALHLNALLDGRAHEVVSRGDAESLLWEAPRSRVVARGYRDGERRSEYRVLLGADGLPLAWWQRCSGGDAATHRLPPAAPHQTVWALGGAVHDLGLDDLLAALAAVAGVEPLNDRRALARPRTAAGGARVDTRGFGSVAPRRGVVPALFPVPHALEKETS